MHPHGIEATFLKLDSWSPGTGFIPIITSNVLNQIKKEIMYEVLCLLKTFDVIFKNWFNPVLGSIPRIPEIISNKKMSILLVFVLFSSEMKDKKFYLFLPIIKMT